MDYVSDSVMQYGKEIEVLGANRPCDTWSTTNPTYHEQGSNQDRHGVKPATNRLSNDIKYAVFILLFSLSAILFNNSADSTEL
jgi:hypothetical protein